MQVKMDIIFRSNESEFGRKQESKTLLILQFCRHSLMPRIHGLLPVRDWNSIFPDLRGTTFKLHPNFSAKHFEPKISVPYEFPLEFLGFPFEWFEFREFNNFLGFSGNFPKNFFNTISPCFESSRIFGWMDRCSCILFD